MRREVLGASAAAGTSTSSSSSAARRVGRRLSSARAVSTSVVRHQSSRSRRGQACRSQAGEDQHHDQQQGSGGGSFFDNLRSFLVGAPRVRFRSKQDRRVEQLAELVVLNEKLKQWELKNSRDFDEEEAEEEVNWIDCRTKVEFLKTRKENWEAIYDSISSHETEATLSDVERIDSKVSSVLSEEGKESLSAADAEKQLLALQMELKQAHERIHLSQARLRYLSERLSDIKSEATLYEDCQDECELEEMRGKASAESTSTGSGAGGAMEDYNLFDFPLTSAEEVDAAASAYDYDMDTSTWYPVCLAQTIKMQEDVVAFDLKGVPWVLFMNNEGAIGCIKDECSHRACPLSLGKVNEKTGHIQCAYHGWEYDTEGQCTDMPSTNISNRSKMNLDSLIVSKSKDGILWVTKNDSANEMLCTAGPPILTDLEEHDCLAEVFVEDVSMRSDAVIDSFTIGGFQVAQDLYTRIVDFAFKRPLTIGFALDAAGGEQIVDYELKFVSHYAFKICLFEKDAKTGERSMAKAMTMVFSCVPSKTDSTNVVFQLYRKRPAKATQSAAKAKERKRTKDKFPFSLPVHKDFVMKQWEGHIAKEIKAMLTTQVSKRTKVVLQQE